MSSKPIYHSRKVSDYTGDNFYVYLITDLNPHSEARYYIGSATRKELVEKNIDPEEDTYYGSSTVPELYDKQKTRSSDLERIIIETFDNVDDCLLAEEQYQRQHRAVENPLFYNKVYAWRKPESELIGRLISETKLNPLWKETVGKEAIEKQLKTKSDPLWKETVGKVAAEKISETKNDPEWKETTGRVSVEKMLNTRSDPLWRDTVGKNAIKKLKETKNDPEWKETVGKEAARKLTATMLDPLWRDTIGRAATVKRLKATGRRFQKVGHRDHGAFRFSRELSEAMSGKISTSMINRLAREDFNIIVTERSTRFCQYLKELPFDPIGMTWAELGFYILDE